jgi:hypothetical protein
MYYKPDETLLIAYLYGELEGEEKAQVEQYLLQHPEERKQLEELVFVKQTLRYAGDKEVIAPPLVFEDSRARYFWNTRYGRMITGIAASLALLILVARFTGLNIRVTDQALTIGFWLEERSTANEALQMASLSPGEVQQMIDATVVKNNEHLQAGWKATQAMLDASVRQNLAAYSDAQFNTLVKKVSSASDEQIRQFALTLQAENASMIKDYLALNTTDQRVYMEELLIDFARYLEQQHRSDLQQLQARLTNMEEDTDLFKYETGQILASIINTVEPISTETKN